MSPPSLCNTPPPTLYSWPPWIWLLSPELFLFQECHISGVTCLGPFCAWFSIMLLTSPMSCVSVCITPTLLFLLLAEQYDLYEYTKLCYPLTRSFGLSPFWTIMNNAAVNICVQVFVWMYVSTSHGWIPRNGMAGSWGKCMFNFLSNCQLFPKLIGSYHSLTSNVWELQWVPYFSVLGTVHFSLAFLDILIV